MTVYVISTLSSGVDYCFYKTAANGSQIIDRTISLNGGANVVNYRTLLTPKGIVSSITDEEYELLKEHPVFKIHLQNGFVKVVKKSPADVDKAVVDLAPEDKSSPLTPKKLDVTEETVGDTKVYRVKRGRKKEK